MSGGPSGLYSQPIPEDVFGPLEDTASPPVHAAGAIAEANMWLSPCTTLTVCVCSGTSSNSNAVSVMYSRGDAVWYRQRDGTDVPAKASPACMSPAMH